MKPTHLLIFVIVLFGAISLGLAFYTFIYARGGSYFSKDSKACINCHIMRENYDSWSHSSHHHVTQCNSCHMPKEFIAGYLSKAYNGFNHSIAFTTGNHPDPIRIKQINKNIVLKNCINCHEQIFKNNIVHMQSKEFNCLHCHQGIGHFR